MYVFNVVGRERVPKRKSKELGKNPDCFWQAIFEEKTSKHLNSSEFCATISDCSIFSARITNVFFAYIFCYVPTCFSPILSVGPPLGDLEAPQAALGALLGHSGRTLRCSLGALGVHLGLPEGSRPLPRPILGGFWIDLVFDLGRFGDRIR